MHKVPPPSNLYSLVISIIFVVKDYSPSKNTMESRRRKQKQVRPQVVLKTNARSKSRLRVDFMPPLLEDPYEECLTANRFDSMTKSPVNGVSSGGVKESTKRERTQSILIQQQYGISGRWRLITAMPDLNHQASRRKKEEGKDLKEGLRGKKEHGGHRKSGFGRWGCFGSAMSACKECHAIGPSRREEALLRESIESQ